MLRIAILEKEETAKEIMFELASLLCDQEWSFQYFTKISQLASAQQEKDFQMIVFHEKFELPRVSQSFVLNHPSRIIIYTREHLSKHEKEMLPFARIFYIKRDHIKSEIHRIAPHIDMVLRNQEEYLFSYNNVEVPLKISDIYYIEKQDKYLIYHTKRGEFRERKSMKHASAYFAEYHFLWIHASYLVNMQYISQIASDMVYLHNIRLPIARARKKEVIDQLHFYVKNNR